ncbi:MAG: hypothetical protein ACFCAD_26080 [Pleurocapsa sp.]
MLQELRFDGIYQYFYKYPSYCHNIRFYQDRIVIAASVQAKGNYNPTKNIVKWFNKNCDSISTGNYTIEGNLIAFSAKNKQSSGFVDWDGKIGINQIILNSFSHINGNRANNRKYIFTPFKTL